MPITTAPELLKLLEKSTLLSDEQLATARAWGETRPKSLAMRLVKEDWLTFWQAQLLLAGKGNRREFFLGKYKLLEMLGHGGMGAVYRAVQPGIGRMVAIKKLHKHVLKQPNAVERFLREIRSAAAVDDPHVVRAYDANCEHDTYYLVLEYVPGQNLKAWIREQGQLPIGWSCECIRQAALGLQHAHQLGLLHRDIKASNLLVTQGDNGLPLVKILDLGLARFECESSADGGLTRIGQIVGTPDYMAPEQAQDSKSADIRADIFSLGCTLFEMLTGRFPYGGVSMMEKLLARTNQEALPLRTFRHDAPVELEAIVAKMLARQPDQRYSTPAEVAAALAPFSIGTAAHPVASHQHADPDHTVSAAPVSSELQALQAEIVHLSAEVDQVGSTGGRKRGARAWILYLAALVAAVALLIGGATFISQQKRRQTVVGADDRQQTTARRAADGETGKSGKATPKDPERQTALWALKLGGTLKFVEIPADHDSRPGSPGAADHGPARTATREGDLPTGRFEITSLTLQGPHELSDSDFQRLAKLTELDTLSLTDIRVPEQSLDLLSRLEHLHTVRVADTPLTNAGASLFGRFLALQQLDLSETRVTGAVLQNLKPLTGLVDLSLAGTAVADKDLSGLQAFPKLEVLNLARTQVKGPGLVALKPLKLLKTLDLGGVPFVGGSIRHLGMLEGLTVLRLSRAKVRDDDLRLLSGLTKLREFVLDSTQVTGEGLRHFTWLSGLERLDMQETLIGDDGLKSLNSLTSLKSLRLRRSLISDRGLQEIQSLKQLEFLDLAETKVTAAGAEALRRNLPNCRIEL
ncbi:MAG: protein kinase [Planctomycetes bacterium]|nr:protein kinase [Planctomycetota bacterium]